MAWLESAAGAAAGKAGAGLVGGLIGGLLANIIRPPMKVKLINGQAIKDDLGAVVMEYDKATAKRITVGSMFLGFCSAIVVLEYWHLEWSLLAVFALAGLIGSPVVYLSTWLLNTLHMRQSTDLINTAVELKERVLK